MDTSIKYHKFLHYICEIELYEESILNMSLDNVNSTYTTDKCKILKIINMINNKEIEKIDDVYYKNAQIYKIRKCNLYDVYFEIQDITFFLSYNKCFYYNFIEDKQYLLFNNGFCGTHDKYDRDGNYIYTILINNDNLTIIN